MSRTKPRDGSNPEGPGFGKPYVPKPGATFVAEGAFVTSLLGNNERPMPLIAMDVQGHFLGLKGNLTMSIIVHADVADDWGPAMTEAAKVARAEAIELGWQPELTGGD